MTIVEGNGLPRMERDEAIRCVLDMGVTLSYDAVGPAGEAAVILETHHALRALGVTDAEMRLLSTVA